MSVYYDRAGTPIGLYDWADLFQHPDYRQVAAEAVGDYRVITAWSGINRNPGSGSPLIFETTVLGRDGEAAAGYPPRSYASETDARAGHRRMCERIRRRVADPD